MAENGTFAVEVAPHSTVLTISEHLGFWLRIRPVICSKLTEAYASASCRYAIDGCNCFCLRPLKYVGVWVCDHSLQLEGVYIWSCCQQLVPELFLCVHICIQVQVDTAFSGSISPCDTASGRCAGLLGQYAAIQRHAENLLNPCTVLLLLSSSSMSLANQTTAKTWAKTRLN